MNYPVNPRVRAYGKARLDLARRVSNGEDWARIWRAPIHPYPFHLGGAWKQCIEYKVDDFAAEIGFFIDILGLQVNSLEPGYAQFTSPQGDFYFAIIETPTGSSPTPPDALRIQFMVEDIFTTALELQQRGIDFVFPPQPCQSGSALHIGSFLTPNGLIIELWGMVPGSETSPYIESEHDLYELMSSEDEEEHQVIEPASTNGGANHFLDQDDEEEFFPGLHDVEDEEEKKPALVTTRLKQRTDNPSSTARGNIPTIKTPLPPRRPEPVDDEDAYVEIDADEQEIQYVDDVEEV
jgi:predicted enzyme related to lactoylglutathione lyase